MLRRILGAAVALALSVTGASAATLQANASNWWTVIRSANGATGDVVQLAADNYGTATLVLPVIQYAAPGITIQPAPGASVKVPPLSIAAANVKVQGLEVLLAPATQYGVEINNSKNITLDGLRIHAADNQTLAGTGVFIRSSTNVTVTRSDVGWAGDGIDSLDTTGLTVTQNNLHDLNSNGTFHGGVIGALIDGNTIGNFHVTATSSHPDALQFSAGTAPSSNVIATNNRVERGAGDLIQGFTGEDINGLVLASNAFLGVAGDGVMCARCNNAAIDYNLVQAYPDAGAPLLLRQASDNAAITNNQAAVYVGVTSDPTQPTHVTQFGNATPPTASGPGDYTVFNAWLAQKAAHPIPAMPVALGTAPTSTGSSGSTATPPPVSLTTQTVDPLQVTVDAQAAQLAADKTTISGLQATITSLKAQVTSLTSQLNTALSSLAGIKKAGGWK